MHEFPVMKITGPIEAGIGTSRTPPSGEFPVMKITGPIEASGHAHRCHACEFPVMKITGPIEAVDEDAIPVSRTRFR